MAGAGAPDRTGSQAGCRLHALILLAAGAAVFLAGAAAPPSLMDDVDAVNAQIARTMLESGDWVSARINGVLYLEKSPLGYWLIAASYAVFGVHDWAARLPNALGAIALMFVTSALARWGFGTQAGLYAGLAIGTSAGLFVFTRILIPDVLLTLAVAAALYCFLRAVEDGGPRWALGYWASIGAGMLLKGLLAAVVPLAAGAIYLLLTRGEVRKLRPLPGMLITAAIYLPWVALAAVRNPPLLDFTLRSEPGVWRGFFWFYFINEHVLRFLNLRFPRDYNTVPRIPFLLLHLVWLFPWSAFWPALRAGGGDRERKTLVLCLAWTGFLLAFLSLSTTQEYYSMPCYPALAVLAGAALARGSGRRLGAGYAALAAVGVAAAAGAGLILWLVRGITPAGDIATALTRNPGVYTLSLGHLHDLTLRSFAWLRGPLAAAGIALAAGSLAAWRWRRTLAGPLCLAAMMVAFFHAARAAMKVFDPYLSSRPLADAIRRGPRGKLVVEGHYYPASSVVYYTNLPALLLNGKQDNLIYGSSAPGAPPVFLEDRDLAVLWHGRDRVYLVAPESSRPRLSQLLGTVYLYAAGGGKVVLTQRPPEPR